MENSDKENRILTLPEGVLSRLVARQNGDF
jgi:hypothetical protein